MTNRRTDKWGGNLTRHARFGFDITKVVIGAVHDLKKVAMRLSHWSTGRNMGMTNPISQFSHIITQIKSLGIAYLYIIGALTQGTGRADAVYRDLTRENDEFLQWWCAENGAPIILSGVYDAAKAQRMLDIYRDYDIAISFGRLFISNPDLPFRFRKGLTLSPYDRETFYNPNSDVGYTDYPYCVEWMRQETQL